jgi:hypothetical protein
MTRHEKFCLFVFTQHACILVLALALPVVLAAKDSQTSSSKKNEKRGISSFSIPGGSYGNSYGHGYGSGGFGHGGHTIKTIYVPQPRPYPVPHPVPVPVNRPVPVPVPQPYPVHIPRAVPVPVPHPVPVAVPKPYPVPVHVPRPVPVPVPHPVQVPVPYPVPVSSHSFGNSYGSGSFGGLGGHSYGR